MKNHLFKSILLAEENLSKKIITEFKNLLKKSFPGKMTEMFTTSFDIELSELKQQRDEASQSYYSWVAAIMQQIRGQNHAFTHPPLNLLKAAMLNTVMRTFVKELQDHNI